MLDIIASVDFKSHLKHIEYVLKRIYEAGLTVNLGKCNFCKEETRYLGVLVNHDGFRPDPERIKPIIEYPLPRTRKQQRRFNGMASWYRKFLKNYAMIAEPLTRLTSESVPFAWTSSNMLSSELKHY